MANRNIYKDIKYEFSQKIGSNCGKCSFVFLQQENFPLELPTYLKDGERFVMIDGIEISTKEFLEINKDKIELDILQLDHLPEDEQRKRGLLEETEKFVPKKAHVSKLSSEHSMRLESLKCQLLCERCHLIETIARENGIAYNSRSKVERLKLEYATPQKLKGCEVCGYKNVDIPWYFHFDHIDPSDKVKEIARMIKDNKYTLEELKKEITKCRVLCSHCHAIHTRKQRESGIIKNNKKWYRISVISLCLKEK